MKISIVIPSRFGSTRFPGKPLAKINGKPMVRHVWEAAVKVRGASEVVVATDDARIIEAVESFGGRGMMTSPDHESGTDRIAEVARRLKTDLVVNLQGDEPMMNPRAIERAFEPFRSRPKTVMSTICTPLESEADFTSPNVVKVIIDRNGDAIYFSRAPIPHDRDGLGSFKPRGAAGPFKHIGLYVYRRDFLLEISKLKPSELEKTEKLEQLRVMENGHKIQVVRVRWDSTGVDTPGDLKRVEKIMRRKR